MFLTIPFHKYYIILMYKFDIQKLIYLISHLEMQSFIILISAFKVKSELKIDDFVWVNIPWDIEFAV